MNLLNTEFKRIFSVSPHKNLKLKLAEMSFCKDFVKDSSGDLYPILEKSEDCLEKIEQNSYKVLGGKVERLICRFFPYATYEISAEIECGTVGICFALPNARAVLTVGTDNLMYSCGENRREVKLTTVAAGQINMIISCRPGAFDIYFKSDNTAEYFCTFDEKQFENSNQYSLFADGVTVLTVSGRVEVKSVSSYIDNGISIADMRPIRYENGDIMLENGKLYLSASIRMQSEAFQGVFAWVAGTAEFELTGAIFYDSGDGKWCGDVAASVLYHRKDKKWYLWVCSFAHGHILGHSAFEGDPRFGVNVVDIELMEKAPQNADISEFCGFEGDEDPDFFYDEKNNRWLMAICRLDPTTKSYRYVFFESDRAFEGYRCIGKGFDGAETGGSFVRVEGECFFVCGNAFDAVSNYRIYNKNGMTEAKFDYPDGGFRGWGTLMPIKAASRTRYFWLTFDRHNASAFNWSYGNLYCFEAL